MRGPAGLSLSDSEERQASELKAEIEEHFGGDAARAYEFRPDSAGAAQFDDRVKREVIRRARKAGWKAPDLDADGGFTVQRP
jgi:hypothetical protein